MKLSSSGFAHYVVPLIVVVLVGIIGTYLFIASHAEPNLGNPYTSQCPGNQIKFGSPRGRTATTEARQKVFGSPGSNLADIQFMGKSITVHTTLVPCFRAVEWDLYNVYNTKYKLTDALAHRPVSDVDPPNYFHAYGAAIDVNGGSNPYCGSSPSQPAPVARCSSAKPFDIPASWRKAFAAHGFFWGGKFPTQKDYMHFEWHGAVNKI